MVKVAVLGYGTVGSGVVEVIENNKEYIGKRCEGLEVKYILDLREFPGDPYEAKLVHDVNIIMEDAQVSIVCETMGGVGAAYHFSRMALERGKSVVTSNKELVAKHGPELMKLARANNCNYLFEASVGGGIPVIRTMNASLTAEKVEAVTGILNGTTNYILSKMEKEGADFDAVLKEAQELGYAERSPEADVEGHDACRKIAILASLTLGKTVDAESIYTEGITGISAADFVYAKAMRKSIKLLGICRNKFKEPYAMVAPFMISEDNPLYLVNGVFNAVCIRGNMLGDSMYYGRGAGKLPTASAVVGDVIDCARHKGQEIGCVWADEKAKMADMNEVVRSFFLRVDGAGLDAVKAQFPGGRVITVEGREDAGYVTPEISEGACKDGCEKLGNLILGRVRIGE